MRLVRGGAFHHEEHEVHEGGNFNHGRPGAHGGEARGTGDRSGSGVPPLQVVPATNGAFVRKWRGRRLTCWTIKTYCPVLHVFSAPSTLDTRPSTPKSLTERRGSRRGDGVCRWDRYGVAVGRPGGQQNRPRTGGRFRGCAVTRPGGPEASPPGRTFAAEPGRRFRCGGRAANARCESMPGRFRALRDEFQRAERHG